MKVLGIDTSSIMTTCAVIEGDKLLGEYSLNQDMSHSEKLVPMIKEVLDNLGLKIQDIDLFAVSVGPGSFTGLRIGVATVKGFAHLYDKPVIGVPTLEALAYNLAPRDIIVPMLDARRDRVYTGIYTCKEDGLETIVEADALEIDELINLLREYKEIYVNGQGSVVYRERLEASLGDRLKFSIIGNMEARGVSICQLGRKKYLEGKRDDYFTLSPDYLRPSQAERNLED